MANWSLDMQNFLDLFNTPPAPTNAPEEFLDLSMLHYHLDVGSSLRTLSISAYPPFQSMHTLLCMFSLRICILRFPILHLLLL
jgi:hypothetical protein